MYEAIYWRKKNKHFCRPSLIALSDGNLPIKSPLLLEEKNGNQEKS